ncbi:hypothetical protein SAMN03097699_2930 [Flavobacteriaceae bacterium MAR_2010_188]|nr:hypothetical protein SAMN03097699_2930 [Flavobacteriaceae bacterium MAR_2010_188]
MKFDKTYKNIKGFVFVFLLLVCFNLTAQQVEHNGTTYYVKGKVILQDGKDVTKNLDADLQKTILDKHEDNMALKKISDQKDKDLKKAEKAASKYEKALKRSEKDLKAKEKAQKNFEKASKKLEDNQKKYDRLSRKGKLSPNDEKDWLKKLEKLQDNVDKYQRRLKKS